MPKTVHQPPIGKEDVLKFLNPVAYLLSFDLLYWGLVSLFVLMSGVLLVKIVFHLLHVRFIRSKGVHLIKFSKVTKKLN